MFPIGSEVRVVADPTNLFDQSPSNGFIRLKVLKNVSGNIARNDLDNRLKSSSQTIYKYQSYGELSEFMKKKEDLLSAYNNLPEFELRKDLLRLERFKNERQKIKILERLLYYPFTGQLEFPELVRRSLTDDKQQKRLINSWTKLKISKN